MTSKRKTRCSRNARSDLAGPVPRTSGESVDKTLSAIDINRFLILDFSFPLCISIIFLLSPNPPCFRHCFLTMDDVISGGHEVKRATFEGTLRNYPFHFLENPTVSGSTSRLNKAPQK